ncbi:hypothetical protein KFK09_001693 [Dendrobium nobile]|uniref:Non-LTR retroelement reverse transcriptase n=1 Tax=Dendrobium nobile TaxID=94219 RepID=A0A8T3C5I4_DENNO|nr:hypothetical protein KFK09_001693 [Dendrobium nobile]
MGDWKVETVYWSRCCVERRDLWSILEKNMIGPGFIGPIYTWCNNKNGSSRIWERLDRCLVNSASLQLVPAGRARHLARMASDHCPIVYRMEAWHSTKEKHFRFEVTWRSYPAARGIGRKSWLKKDFGDELRDELKKDILDLQTKEMSDVNFLIDDMCLLRQKDWPEIEASQRLNELDRKMLNTDFVREECMVAVFQQDNNKSPGADGVTSSFFKSYWNIVGETTWLAIKKFFSTGIMHKNWKDTLIVLIPKVNNPIVPSNFRPISLCQTTYKIVASMLVDRLKTLMYKMISEEQLDFTPEGGKYLKDVVKWRVCNGKEIDVLGDIWVLDRSFNCWPTCINCVDLEDLKVQDGGRDMLEPVKKLTGYSILALAFEAVMNKRYNAVDDGFYDRLKKLKLNFKVVFFLWKLSKFAIPTNSFLKFRRLVTSDSCVRGYCEAENYEHIVNVWNWKNRNLVKHEKPAMSASMVAVNLISLATSNLHPFLDRWGANLSWEFLNSWHPPPLDWIKVNVDSSLLSNYRAGIGGIFRDCKGRVLLALGRNSLLWDIAQLELESIFVLWDFILGWMLESAGAIIESDNFNVINYIQQSMKKTYWHLEESLGNKLYFLNDFNKVVSHHGNADVVEKFVSALESSSDKDKVAEGIRPGISLSNIYDALIENNEEDSLQKHGKSDKMKELAVEIDDTGAVNNGTSYFSGSTKVKLAKELKSLGPLDPDYKKKKRDGRLNSTNREGSPALI